MASANLIQVTPFLGVAEMDRALAFYREVLGFTCFVNSGGYAYLERERIGLRLLELDAGARNPPGCSHIYIDLRDAAGFHSELATAIAALPPERRGGLRDQPYGQREFWVRDPDGNLITFGEGIGANATQWDYRDEP